MVQRLSDQDPAPKDLIRSGLNLAGFQPIHKYGTQIAIFLNWLNLKNQPFPKTRIIQRWRVKIVDMIRRTNASGFPINRLICSTAGSKTS